MSLKSLWPVHRGPIAMSGKSALGADSETRDSTNQNQPLSC